MDRYEIIVAPAVRKRGPWHVSCYVAGGEHVHTAYEVSLYAGLDECRRAIEIREAERTAAPPRALPSRDATTEETG